MVPNKSFRDLNLNFSIHPVRKDVAKLTNENAIKTAVRNLVLTKHYERPFHPEIGCNVTSLLFENIDPLTAIAIRRSIQDVIINFEPRVSLIDVIVDVTPDLNAYTATIVFTIQNRPEPITLDVILERLR